MSNERKPFDLARLEPGQNCFICEFLSGNPRYRHHIVGETESGVAFLNRFPTTEGYVLVVPRQHREQVTGDFDEGEYLELQKQVYAVSESLRELLSPERVYILSLGSQAANAHVHWHVAPLPQGVPLEHQQYYALMHEHGVIDTTEEEMMQLAERLRPLITARLEERH